jgi:hypothetical protein
MKLKILALFFISIFSVSIVAFAENPDRLPSPKHAQTLGQLHKFFKNRRGLAKFNEELSGINKEDGLGTNLPPGLTAKDIVRLIAPNEDSALVIVVGAKAFPYRLNSYVVIACFVRGKNKYAQEIDSADKSCKKKSYGRDDVVYLGLIEYEPKASRPKLIAKSLEIDTSWDFITPKQLRSASHKKNVFQSTRKFELGGGGLTLALFESGIYTKSTILPNGKYKEFDFAPFKISDNQTAFGLRVGNGQGYAGGFGYFEVLTLFTIDNNQIINVLAEPIYFYQNIAGDWNKNGTRQHDLYEGENVLAVLPSKTYGYYDLQIKSLDSEWERVLAWNDSQKRYLPIDVPETSVK